MTRPEPELRLVSASLRPGSEPLAVPGDRRSEYDITDTVRVSSADDVRTAVCQLFQQTYPGAATDVLWIAFHDFRRLFAGEYADYVGCDTVYHDTQHTLDVTLATARLLAGYERSAAAEDRLGEERATVGLITALFHDSGYVRRRRESQPLNGAEYTRHHVSRSAAFLARYLPQIGLGAWAHIASQMVHFTGYEVSLDDIELDDPRDSIVGHLVGTADLLAQMADRCYLEKCRDRLYAEFVLGGVATMPAEGQGVGQSAGKRRYESGIDLLRQTPQFYLAGAHERLEKSFDRSYRYLEVIFDGRNPYLEGIQKNLDYLDRVIRDNAWDTLRREPPCFTVLEKPLETVSGFVTRRLAQEDAARVASAAG